ncbi:MAG: amidohydrolase family protein [Dyadobacter sp.]
MVPDTGKIRSPYSKEIPVLCDIPSSLTMQDVMAAGLSSIEHMSYVLRAGTKNEKEIAELSASGKLKGRELNNRILADFDERTAMKVYGDMAKHDMYVTPTLSLPHLLAHLDEDNHQNDAYLLYMGKGLQKTYQMRIDRTSKDDKDAIAFRKLIIEKSESLLPLLQKAGVKIMAGTDAGYLNSFTYPGIGLHKELELMVAAGLSTLQALQASIINQALFLNKKKYGSLAKGKKADILLLDENPLLNISSTQKMYTVVVKGKPMTQSDVKAALDDVKTKTAAGL